MKSGLGSRFKQLWRTVLPGARPQGGITPEIPPSFNWFGVELPAWAAEQNILLIGAQGTGKTLASRDLMRSFLPQIDTASVGTTSRRALVYDVKLDAMSELSAMGLRCPIILINPFDSRSWSWDVAADVSDPSKAYEFAKALVPEKQYENPFFPGAGQALLSAVTTMLMTRLPGQWTLRDVLLVCYSKDGLKAAKQSADPVTRDRLERYFSPQDTFDNVAQTLINQLVPLQTVAAIWDNVPASRRLSIRRWASEESSVLVLGRNEEYAETLNAINRLIIKTAAGVILSGPEVPSADWKTWFFCDELRMAGRLDGLGEMLTTGRSKGLRNCLGFQDVEGLHEVYGPRRAEEFIGLFGNVSLLRMTGPRTAKWASERVGQAERVITTRSRAFDRNGHETGVSESQTVSTTDALLASQFYSLPLSKGGRVEGFHIIPALGGVYHLAHTFPLFSASRSLDFVPLTDGIRRQTLRPWTNSDRDRLGFVPEDPMRRPERDAATSKPGKRSRPKKSSQKAIPIDRIDPPDVLPDSQPDDGKHQS